MKERKSITKSMAGSSVGIDIGEPSSAVTYLSPDGEVMDSFSFNMDDTGYSEFMQRIPTNARIAFEATGLAYTVTKRLRSLGYGDITVAHPKELAWIVKSKKKNDIVDSLKLAKLHLVDMLPKSTLLDDSERIRRDLLIQRVRLGKDISSVKNSITGYLKREGMYNSLPDTSDTFSVKRREAIEAIHFGDEKDLVLKTMLQKLKFYEEQCEPIEAELRKRANDDEQAKLLMSIPGISYYLASLLSSYIGSIDRFESDDKLASFFGVVPTMKDSSNVKRRGRMSKDGASTARWALSIAVDTTMDYNKPLREYYNAVKKRTSSGKMAHVSTMRKLVRMLYHMLKNREQWKYENPSLTDRKLSELDKKVN